MNNMNTNVSAIDAVSTEHYNHDEFSTNLMGATYESLKSLADKVLDSSDYESYGIIRELNKLLVITKISLQLDRQYNVIDSCFYYGHVNTIAEKVAVDGVKGLVEYFYPTKIERTEEEEIEYQKGINELLGI